MVRIAMPLVFAAFSFLAAYTSGRVLPPEDRRKGIAAVVATGVGTLVGLSCVQEPVDTITLLSILLQLTCAIFWAVSDFFTREVDAESGAIPIVIATLVNLLSRFSEVRDAFFLAIAVGVLWYLGKYLYKKNVVEIPDLLFLLMVGSNGGIALFVTAVTVGAVMLVYAARGKIKQHVPTIPWITAGLALYWIITGLSPI